MTRRKNAKGYCDERSIDVQESDLCDYFQGKRRNSKARCRSCIHFHVLEEPKSDEDTNKSITKQDDV